LGFDGNIEVSIPGDYFVYLKGTTEYSTWIDQQTVPRVPRTLAAMGIFILVERGVCTLRSKEDASFIGEPVVIIE
jgi:hypothetical protein